MNYTGLLPALAFTSDRAIDFTPPDFDRPLTAEQQSYLLSKTGQQISQVFWRKQVHEDAIITAQGAPNACAGLGDADAFVTSQPQLPIAIRTADCVPVVIVDPARGAVGIAHAGWKGTYKHIAAKTIKTMKDKFGSQCYDLRIALGPAIRACCYQVGPEFQGHFPNDVQVRSTGLYFDMIAANIRQLTDMGVPIKNILADAPCTACSKEYFSYRREGAAAGRMISLVMLP